MVHCLVLLALCGCGRMGFDATRTDDGGAGDSGPIGDGGLPVCNKVARLYDDFSAAVLDDGVWGDSYANGNTMVGVAGGDAVITLEPNAADVYAAARTTRFYDVRESRIIGEISQLAPSLAITGLQIDYLSQVYASVSHYNGTLRAAYRPIGGVHTNVGMTTYVASQHRYFALAERAGTLYFETSPDGLAFTSFAQMPVPFDLALVRVSPYAGTDTMVAAPGQAHFARIGPPGGGQGATCPASSFVDTFDAGELAHHWYSNNVDACCTMTVNSGAMTITTDGTAGNVRVRGSAGMDLRGDSFQVELSQAPSAVSVHASLIAQLDDLNRLELRVTATQTVARVLVAGTLTVNMSAARDPLERFLKIGESGGTISYQVSKDAITWRDLYAGSAPFAVDDIIPYLRVDTTAATTADTVRFDNFNVR